MTAMGGSGLLASYAAIGEAAAQIILLEGAMRRTARS